MAGFISSLTSIETFYFVCAVLGSLFFILKSISLIFGFFSDVSDVEIDHDLDLDNDAGHISDSDSGDGITYLSLHGISSFLMMFGWVGLAMLHSSHTTYFAAIVAALFAGSISIIFVAKTFQVLSKLKSSGNERIISAFGKSGTVYLRIPPNGIGQIEVEVDGRLRTCDAKSYNNETIETGTKVKVTFVDEKGILTVEPDLEATYELN